MQDIATVTQDVIAAMKNKAPAELQQRLGEIDTKLTNDNLTWQDKKELKFQKAWLECVNERKKVVAKDLRKQSNLGARFERRTFETFDTSKNKAAYDKCIKYDMASTEKNSLVLIGNIGTGKTHLAAAIANKMLDEGVSVLFDTYSGYLEKIKAEYRAKKGNTLKLMKDVQLLIIDDVGKEKQSEWSESILFDVINHRYERLMPIIITSNLSEQGLREYLNGASYSRIYEMSEIVKVVGEDYRLTKMKG